MKIDKGLGMVFDGMNSPLVLFLLAFLVDQLIGDPVRWPHPVVGMGKMIAAWERCWNDGSPLVRKSQGVILTVTLVGGCYFLTWGIITLAYRFNAWCGFLVSLYFLWTTLAGKSLLEAGKQVLIPLQQHKLAVARQSLARYVSRETDQLSETEIVRGTVETLAENFVDGFLSPLFFAVLGGAPLAMAFKAVSTLDSMIGYRNERFKDFGWFAARSDDWANYLPARLSVPILLTSGFFFRLPVGRAFRVWRRDARLHPSPNGGNPESIVAGLLGVQLGGINVYHGKSCHRAEMGDLLHPMSAEDIVRCMKLVRMACILALAVMLWGLRLKGGI